MVLQELICTGLYSGKIAMKYCVIESGVICVILCHMKSGVNGNASKLNSQFLQPATCLVVYARV